MEGGRRGGGYYRLHTVLITSSLSSHDHLSIIAHLIFIIILHNTPIPASTKSSTENPLSPVIVFGYSINRLITKNLPSDPDIQISGDERKEPFVFVIFTFSGRSWARARARADDTNHR